MDVIFYVIWCGEDRLKSMIDQFVKMKFKHRIVFFEGTTPEKSKDWIDPEAEHSQPRLQCCARSHILALKDFHIKHRDKKYICVIEDDVCLLKDNFIEKLEEIIETYEKNKDIEYVSLGYLPWNIKNEESITKSLYLFKKDSNIYHDFSKSPITIWGTQSYIMRREYVAKALSVLDKPSCKEVIQSVWDFIDKNGRYQNKYLYMTPDSILPLVLKQGFCFPMLGIEGNISSIIHGQSSISKRFELWKKMETLNVINREEYN